MLKLLKKGLLLGAVLTLGIVGISQQTIIPTAYAISVDKNQNPPTVLAASSLLEKAKQRIQEKKHTHVYKTKISMKATCKARGYVVEVCTECGNTRVTRPAALGHNYVQTVVAPTHLAQGYTINRCTRCNDIFNSDYVEVLSWPCKEVQETVWANTGVNVRQGPGTDYDIIGGLEHGESTTRTGIGDNGWSRINYNGQEGYVYSKYIQNYKLPEETIVPDYHPTNNIYNDLTSAEKEMVAKIINHCDKYMNGEISSPKMNFAVSKGGADRVAAYLKVEYAHWGEDAFIKILIVNGEEYVYVDATNYANILAQKNRMDAEIDRIVSTFYQGTEKEMLKQIADYLRNHLDYQDGYSGNLSGAKALFSGKGNCEAFSQLFAKMAQRVGIKCDWCHGTANGAGHAWNRVVLKNGSVYYYDACWYNSTGSTKYLHSAQSLHNLTGINSIGNNV